MDERKPSEADASGAQDGKLPTDLMSVAPGW